MRFLFFLLLPTIGAGQVSWQGLGTAPIDIRISDQYFVLDSSVYLEGGLDSHADPISSVWQYRIDSNIWQQMSIFDTIRAGGGTVVRDTGYIVGGWGYHKYLTSCWQYNRSADQWSAIGSLPEPIAYGSTFSAMGRLFIGGGYDTNEIFLASVWEYDFAAGTWVVRSPMPGGGRDGVATSVVDSFVYFVGGNYTVVPGSNLSVNDFYRYNVYQDHWDSLPPVPGLPRAGANVYAFKNFLIVAFGEYENGAQNIFDSIITDMYRYDFDSAKWSPIIYTGAVTPSAEGTYFNYGTKCYLFGGIDNGLYEYGDTMYVFDAAALGAIVDTGATTGIAPIAPDQGRWLKVYPSLATEQSEIHISANYSGIISFYNSQGQLIFSGPFLYGDNLYTCMDIKCSEGLMIYQATASDGSVRGGKIIITK